MAAVNMMLKGGLVETDHFKRQLDSAGDSVKVTYSGFIHMRLLLGSLEYLYGSLPTTPVFNASIANRIKTSLERGKRPDSFLSDATERRACASGAP